MPAQTGHVRRVPVARVVGVLSVVLALGLGGCTTVSRTPDPPPLATVGTRAGTTASGALDVLRTVVGQDPRTLALWAREPLKSRLQRLLGATQPRFAERMEVASLVQDDHDVVYVIGNRRSGTSQRAIFMADVPGDALHVWLIDGKAVTRFQEGDAPVQLPDAVLALLANLAEAGTR